MNTGISGSRGTVSQQSKYITFTLAQEEYAIPVLQAVEIVKLETLIPLPHSLEYVLGLMDIRGSVIPVIHLRKRLGISVDEEEKVLERAIIIRAGEKRLALAVEQVRHVHGFYPDDIDEGPTAMKSASNRFVAGVAKIEERFIIILNLDGLFTNEELRNLSVHDISA